MAINQFLSGTISNWGSTSSWSLGVVPSNNGDLIVFTSSSATCSLNISIATCSQIDFTNYNKQFRFNANALGVFGTISLGTNMGYSFSATGQFNGYNLAIAASASITSNGATIGVPTILYSYTGNNNVYNITDYLNITENFSTGAQSSNTNTINGGTISLYKGFYINSGSNTSTNLTTGTSNIVMLGTGTLAITINPQGGIGNNFTIGGTGTITLPTNFYYKTGLFSIIGTPTLVNNSILYVTGACSFIAASSSSTYILPFLITASTQTVTLLSDIHSSRGINSAGLTLNGFNYYIYGNLLSNVTTGAGGTTTYRISGTGSGSSVTLSATTQINNNIVINTPGIATFASGGFLFGGSNLTYTAGNINVLGIFQTVTATNQTFTMPSTKFLTVQLGNPNNTTYTLLSDWNMTTLTIGGALNLTFTGSNAWTTDILNENIGGTNTITLKNGLTYSVLKSINLNPIANYANLISIISGASGSYANLYLAPGSTQSMYSISMKDINNVGTPLWIYNPTIINSTNVWTLNWQSVQQTTINSF